MANTIKTVLNSFFKATHKDSWKVQLLTNWNDIIGTLKDKVHLEKIQDDTLVLGVKDSCWMQELYMLSHVLLASINQKLDQPRIKHLRFKTAGVRAQKKYTSRLPQRRTPKPVRLKAHEQHALKKIDDPQLSAALKGFLIRCYQENE